MQKNFIHEVIEIGIPGMSVLDVGAGILKATLEFRAKGYDVTALDIKIPPCIPEGIKFIETDFMKWEPDKEYDILFMQNSAQFIPKQQLLKKISLMKPKIIAVATFYGNPTPDFPGKYAMTFYESKDFEFFGYIKQLLKKEEHESLDMKGTMRLFRTIKYIGVRQ